MNDLARMFPLVAAGALGLLPSAAGAACKLGKVAEFPITMNAMRPTMSAKINGADVGFIVDSGAFYSMIGGADAAQYHLKTYPAPWGLAVSGVGGHAGGLAATTVQEFTLPGVPPLHNVEFLVGGSEVGSDSIGVLGQNILRVADVEYDLADGVIRLWHEDDCAKTNLAYWLAGSPQNYSVIEIDATTPRTPHTLSVAYVNGARIRVMFDTGADRSMLSRYAASRAGFAIDAAGVVEGGYGRGIGRGTIKTWIAPFVSFKLGDEEVRNTKLRVADSDIGPDFADMLIGADFFLSHRVYVSNKQRKLFFTYNGGPVFNLSAAPLSQPQPPPAPPSASALLPGAADSPQAPQNQPSAVAGEPKTAAQYSRRGAAFAARRDFDHALSNLDRACELAPDQPDYFYERGTLRLRMNQRDAALADFDQAIKLQPDHVLALLSRAELHLAGGKSPGAIEDLNAVSGAVAREADARLRLGIDYANADLLAQALTQLDAWIEAHPDDVRRARALNARCRAKALLGQELPTALEDCNASIKRIDTKAAGSASFLVSRALIQLRLGDYAKSMKAFDAALAVHPKDAWALYGRGIDKIRLGLAGDGNVDIAAATGLSPEIADSYTRYGIMP